VESNALLKTEETDTSLAEDIQVAGIVSLMLVFYFMGMTYYTANQTFGWFRVNRSILVRLSPLYHFPVLSGNIRPD